MCKKIHINVRNREATYISGKYICGNKDFTVEFDFDEEWDNAEVKTARFVWGGKSAEQIFQGKSCRVPFINDTTGFYVGVFTGDLSVTTRAFVPTDLSIISGGGLPADPPPDVYAQILDLLNKGGASAEQIQNAVQDYLEKNPPQGVSDDHIRKVTEDLLNEAKESGEFDGEPGLPGKNGEDGEDGKDGASAYEIAAEHGFEGSVEEWLESLRGAPGKDGAGGQPGADGVSPTVAVSKSGKVTTITITDKNGTKTATINDGADGEDGSASVADGSITPEKTSFIICEGTGETESTIIPNFTNVVDPTSSDFKAGYRYNASNAITTSTIEKDKCFVSNMFDIKGGDVLRIKGVRGSTSTTATAPTFVVSRLDADGNNIINSAHPSLSQPLGTNVATASQCWDAVTTLDDGTIVWTYAVNNAGTNVHSGAVKARVAGVATDGIENVIVTVNEEITYTEITSGGKTYTLDEKITVPRAKGLTSGAKWFALGDSITEGWASAVDASASSGYRQFLNSNEAERWVNIVADMNGYELTNYGVGGTGYAHAKNGTANARGQVANIDFSQCDFVTLAYGVNDWKGKATLGSMDDDVDTVDAFVPNMRFVIKKILAGNPYCKIFVITPLNCRSLGTYDTNWGINYLKPEYASGPGLEDIFQLEKTVCEYHGIELIDMTHCSIINRENIKTMLPDYVHPTVECHKMMARELAQKITFR